MRPVSIVLMLVYVYRRISMAMQALVYVKNCGRKILFLFAVYFTFVFLLSLMISFDSSTTIVF